MSCSGQRAFFASIPNQQRETDVRAPNQLWVGDLTYLKVAGQWRYLAAVMDRHSRRIVGWSLSVRRDAALTSDANTESFFHSMKAEQIHGMKFDDDQELRQALRSYIAFYNQHRIHSSPRYLPPDAFEQQEGHQPCVN